jgi:hypothetical protein
MVPLNIHTESNLGELADDVRLAFEKALGSVGIWWKEEVLPGHFTQGAYRKYGVIPQGPYQVRTKHSMRDNLGSSGRRDYDFSKPPMVRSGTMRAQILSSARVKATSKNVSISATARALNFVLSAPMSQPEGGGEHEYFYHSGTRWKVDTLREYPNFFAELTAVNRSEEDRFKRIIDETLEKELADRKPAEQAA